VARKNKDYANYISARSRARSFIKNKATLEDIEEFKKLIEETIKDNPGRIALHGVWIDEITEKQYFCNGYYIIEINEYTTSPRGYRRTGRDRYRSFDIRVDGARRLCRSVAGRYTAEGTGLSAYCHQYFYSEGIQAIRRIVFEQSVFTSRFYKDRY